MFIYVYPTVLEKKITTKEVIHTVVNLSFENQKQITHF